jgi:hypothetical protein
MLNEYTELLLDRLPHWFALRKNVGSLGAQFLDIFGLQLSDIDKILTYAYEQPNLSTMDINYISECYKTIVPVFMDSDKIKLIYGDGQTVIRLNYLNEFAYSTINDDICYIDTTTNVIYTRKHYTNFSFIYDGKTYTQELSYHQVWNYFDEFGLLLDCPRIKNETNLNYKERLFNVFKFPSNATKTGLYNYISNALDLRKNIIWEDMGVDFIFPNLLEEINIDSIYINGSPIARDLLFKNDNNELVLKGNEELVETEGIVSYIIDLKILAMNDKTEYNFQNELISIDNRVSKKLYNYKQNIETFAPISWNYFLWNECNWNSASQAETGIGNIPTITNASISGFESWVKK